MNTLRDQIAKGLRSLHWLPSYGWQRLVRRQRRELPVHLMIAGADHFEPSFFPGAPGTYAAPDEQERGVERWCREYPRAVDAWGGTAGGPFRQRRIPLKWPRSTLSTSVPCL